MGSLSPGPDLRNETTNSHNVRHIVHSRIHRMDERGKSYECIRWLVAAVLIVASPGVNGDGTDGKWFADITTQAGITHVHHRPALDEKLSNIMPWMAAVGAAAAASDYNNDGFVDLYVTQSKMGEPNLLYRNNGDFTFTDMALGVADSLHLVGQYYEEQLTLRGRDHKTIR